MSTIQQQTHEDIQELGNCPEHERPYECFCTDCSRLICPSCLMFGICKGHNVCRIEDAARDLRTKIDDAGKQGLLKAERSENILLDIRHTKLNCEEKKQKILNEVEASFSAVMKALKKRKEIVLSQINDHFDTEFSRIYSQEQNWVQKQEVSQDLVNLARSQSDLAIINNASLILNGIKSLSEPQQYQNVQLINSLDTHLVTPQGTVNQDEFTTAISEFVQKGELIKQQYKC